MRLDEQVGITVAHLHFMARCRRLAALMRVVARLWLEVWDHSGTSVTVFFFFFFFNRVEGCDWMWSLQNYGYLKRSTLNSSFIIFDPLDPFFFVFVSWLLSLILFPIFPRGLFSDCVHVTSVCSPGCSLCVWGRSWPYLNVRLNLLWLLHRS